MKNVKGLRSTDRRLQNGHRDVMHSTGNAVSDGVCRQVLLDSAQDHFVSLPLCGTPKTSTLLNATVIEKKNKHTYM